MFTCNTLHIFNLKRKNSVSNFVSRTQKGSKSSHWKHVTDFNNLQQIFLHLFISWEQIKFCRKVCSKSPKKALLQKISFHISNFFLGLKEFSLKKHLWFWHAIFFISTSLKNLFGSLFQEPKRALLQDLCLYFNFFFKGPKSFLWKSLTDFCVFFLACNQKMFTCNILYLIISWEKNVQIFVSLAQKSYAQKTSFYWNFASRPKRKSSPKKT